MDSYELGNHDNNAGTPETYAYTCTSNTAFSPPVNITCGTTLLPKQLDRLCHESTDSALPGTGAVQDPFGLCSPTHLRLIGDTGTNAAYTLSASYAMGQDINLNNVSFTPIGGTFTGILDGKDKKIMNLTVNVSGPGALFIKLGSGGNIKNLGIKEFDVTGSGRVGSLAATSLGTITSCYAVDSDEATDVSGGANSYVGGLVGVQAGNSSITSSYATGNSEGSSGNSYVGGLVGYQDGNGSITSSYATGNSEGSSGSSDIGGLVGRQGSGGTITSSHATGNPSGGSTYTNHIGGLVGIQAGGSITSSYATGNPEGIGSDYIGGLVGHQASGSITSSYATGNPEGGDSGDLVGGLVGYQKDGGSITSSYATGSPDGGGNVDSVGGLLGYQDDGSITSSYTTGSPGGGSGNDNVGGLVGYQAGNSSITSSYTTGSPEGGSGNDKVGGLVGYQDGGSITSSYATGNPDGGSDDDRVGGLVGRQSRGSITSSYATGNPDGGDDNDNVGGLVGFRFGSSLTPLTSNYGFGTTVNGETSNTHGTPPSGVSSASGLTQTNSGTSDTNRWSTNAWNFGTSSQAPALKYVDSYELGDHDNDGSTTDTYGYTCTSNTAFLPPVNITCGTTLLPNQR